MSMQDRINKIHAYLDMVDFMLQSIQKSKNILDEVSSKYTKSGQNVELSFRDITYYRRSGCSGLMIYKKDKRYPDKATELGTLYGTDSFVTMDELIYTICNLEEFSIYAIAEISKDHNQLLRDAVNGIKESAVADLL